jgi:hypothetical protein
VIVGPGLLRGRSRFAAARNVVVPGAISGLTTFTRAQATGVESAGLGSDGTTWDTYAADTPRFVFPNGGLLIEGQRTNAVTNPRGEGASGTATLPTTWTLSATRGLTHTFTPAVVNGVEGVVWAFSGTPNSTSGTELSFEAGLTSTAGQLCALSLFYQLVAGTNTLSNLTLRNANEAAGTATPFSPDATLRRVTNVTTAVGTVYRCRISFGFPNIVTPVNTSIFLGWPQREQLAAFAATPILPPIGTPGASTRGADIASTLISGFGLTGNGVGTILMRATLPQSAPTGVNQMLFQVDDGSDSNRYVVRNAGGGNTIEILNVVGGVAGSPVSLGSMTPGTTFSVGVTYDAAGRLAGALNAGAVQAVTGGPTSGLTRLLEGSSGATGGTEAMHGTIQRLIVLPRLVSDAELRSLVSGLV